MNTLKIKQLLFLCFVTLTASAQSNYATLADKYARVHFKTFADFLSIKSDAHNHDDLRKNLVWISKEFKKRNFELTELATPTVPLLLAERKSKLKDAKTVLIYLQIDGQPVKDAEWQQASPWIPVLKKKVGENWVQIPMDTLNKGYDREWRFFARAAADAKGPDVMFLAALDAAAEAKIEPNYNIKVIMDFEEELGSPNLPKAVDEHAEKLKSDMLIIFDGPPHISNVPTLNYGARGIAEITLTTFGSKLNVHSGNYGNYVPNPGLKMVKLLASMKDDDGRVLLKGFYDGIEISEEYRKILAQVPDNEDAMKKKLGFKEADKVASTFQEALQYPTLNIRGLKSGEVLADANTIIPARAIAELDIRLPLESDPNKLIALVKQHCVEQGFYVIDHDPTDEERAQYAKILKFRSSVSYLAFRTPYNTLVSRWLNKALANAHGKEAVKIPTVGGSIPISPFVTKLAIDAVAVPTVNPDNNQHSPNENLRIGNFVDGIQTMIAILAEKL
jgi:acetylornithine deacetylase/succinyl-diaminopimelate desuccinylase-like protein